MTRQWTHAVAQRPHFAPVVALAFRLQETQVAELWFANRRLLDVSLSSAVLCNVWVYKDLHVEDAFRADLIIDDKVLVEVKSAAAIQPIHKVQVLTYLRLTGLRLGLVMDFNTACLREGVDRVANGLV